MNKAAMQALMNMKQELRSMMAEKARKKRAKPAEVEDDMSAAVDPAEDIASVVEDELELEDDDMSEEPDDFDDAPMPKKASVTEIVVLGGPKRSLDAAADSVMEKVKRGRGRPRK